MKNTPLVSVIMPVYNVEEYLKEAIDSIIGQTLEDFEFIIVDDASTDRSMTIIQSYTDKRIKVIHNKNNKGNYASRNIGLEEARGKYIAVMDADDRALPERLLTQYSYMEQHSEILACGSLFYINESIVSKPLSYPDIRAALLQNNCFLHPSLFIRAKAMKGINGYDEKYYYSSDYDLACRLSLAGKIVNLSDVLMEYRLHKEQISQKHAGEQKYYADDIRNRYRKEVLKNIPHISIVIPLRIESEERYENLHCVLQHLLRIPFVHIELLEADKERRFHYNHHERVRYRFIHDEEKVFYRTRYLNMLLKNAQYPIVGVWDADVLIPEHQLIASIWHILEGDVLCFPYDGDFRFLEKDRSRTIRKQPDELQRNDGFRLMGCPSVGGAFLVNRGRYLQAGGENEGFYGWGPEDVERVKRLEILELPIGRTQGSLYHLHHERKADIGIDNRKKAMHNQKVLLNTCKMSKAELTHVINKCQGIFSYLENLNDPANCHS